MSFHRLIEFTPSGRRTSWLLTSASHGPRRELSQSTRVYLMLKSGTADKSVLMMDATETPRRPLHYGPPTTYLLRCFIGFCLDLILA